MNIGVIAVGDIGGATGKKQHPRKNKREYCFHEKGA